MGFVQTHFIAMGMPLHLSRLVLAGLFGLMGPLSIGGSLALAAIADRGGPRTPLALAYALRAAGFAAWTAMYFTDMPALLLQVGIVAIGLSWAATIALTTTACTNVWTGRAGGVMGVELFVMWLGHALGTWVPAVILDHSGSYLPAIAGNVVVTATAAVVVLSVRAPALCAAPAVAGHA